MSIFAVHTVALKDCLCLCKTQCVLNSIMASLRAKSKLHLQHLVVVVMFCRTAMQHFVCLA